MNPDLINEAIVLSISDSAIPRVDREKLIDRYGQNDGRIIADQVLAIVKEAVAMPIEWGSMTLAQGVNDIMTRFSVLHPDLSPQALEEIGRCVGWQLR
ncbi:hypothetical protein [Mycolicibacterium peregrinum]|uniref:Uncharacterized protein n=1 Tax=Mycolicibacterium peregrinum TaxID=43304 RepID=A0A1A0W7P9_MYCPR|nr:hypothetical protein [Mycolicibacterium peregrinum]OBB92288.1 hypothetical protein A5779_22260 [Mycolicibacterium peregrinum]